MDDWAIPKYARDPGVQYPIDPHPAGAHTQDLGTIALCRRATHSTGNLHQTL